MADLTKGYNEQDQLRSHSSALSNERIAFLLAQLDNYSIMANRDYDLPSIKNMKAVLFTLWKSVRALPTFSYNVRKRINLETQIEGVYTLDIAFDLIDAKLFSLMTKKEITYVDTYPLLKVLNKVELTIKDILQFFQYTFRQEHKQMPDVIKAAEEFKQVADKLTVQQLQEVIGKNHKIDFSNMGGLLLDDK